MNRFDISLSRRRLLELMTIVALGAGCKSSFSDAIKPDDTATPDAALPNAARPDSVVGACAFAVDLARVVARVSPQHIGVCCTTYGRNALTSPEQAEAEASLDFRYVRLPVGVRAGRVTSSAAGGPTDLDMRGLVDWYRARDARVIAVLGGRTDDVDIAPGDAARMVRELGPEGIEYSGVNEPNNKGLNVEQSIALSQQIAREIAGVQDDLKLWGPVWAWCEHPALLRFAEALGDHFAGLSYHSYGMGVDSLTTARAMSETPRWGRDVQELRAGLRALQLPDNVSVTELNFSWRYEDGTPPDGKNRRFFSAINTVWTASVLGHILRAGGKAAVYGNQNGPLGVWTEKNHPINQQQEVLRDLPPSSPMPAYWGIAAWTGAHRFPHFKERVFDVQRVAAPDEAELFAVDNEAGGTNLVMINKSETQSQRFAVALKGAQFARHHLWRTDSNRPFAAPRQLASDAPLSAAPSWELPPMCVAIAVLK